MRMFVYNPEMRKRERYMYSDDFSRLKYLEQRRRRAHGRLEDDGKEAVNSFQDEQGDIELLIEASNGSAKKAGSV